MRRRRFWWRNPDPELELPPDEIDLDAELLSLGHEVPSSVDDLMDLDVPEDYEVDLDQEIPANAFPWVQQKKKRGRPKGSGKKKMQDSDLLDLEVPEDEIELPVMSFEQAKRLVNRKRTAGRPSKELAAKLAAARRVLGLGTGDRLRLPAGKTRKAAPAPRVSVEKEEKQMSQREALKIVAKFAGKRGKRSGDFKAALKVLCSGANMRRKRSKRRGR